MNYRPEIDGLRAIAVVSVIFYHTYPTILPGGFVGVDIFFVISGFLITSIILNEMGQGNFSYIAFYERRIRRVIPALFLIITTCLIIGYIVMTPRAMKELSQSTVSTVFFASNMYFFYKTGYFDPSSDYKPLLHTWSLAIEEQFYIILPPLIYLINYRRLSVEKSLITICILSFVICLVTGLWSTDANYYFISSRIWELGVGSLLAHYRIEKLGAHPNLTNALSYMGLALLLSSILFVNDEYSYPGLATIPSVIGTALVLANENRNLGANLLLAWRPFVFIGILSYSLYLWHQPVLAFAKYAAPEIYSHSRLALLLLIAVLSYLSWRFVEKPFRSPQAVTRQQIFALFSVGTALISACAFSGVISSGFPNRLGPEGQALMKWLDQTNPIVRSQETLNCTVLSTTEVNSIQRLIDHCAHFNSEEPTIVLWGDSHAERLKATLTEQLDYPVVLMAHYLCPPLIDVDITNIRSCLMFNEKVANILERNLKSGDVVVLAARWPLYVEGSSADNGEGGLEPRKPNYIVRRGFEGSVIYDRKLQVSGALNHIVSMLNSRGVRVILVYAVPEAGWDLPDYLVQRTMLNASMSSEEPTVRYDYWRQRSKNANEALDEVRGSALTRIYPDRLLCQEDLNKCALTQDGLPLYLDSNHLNSLGSAIVTYPIAQKLNDFLHLNFRIQ